MDEPPNASPLAASKQRSSTWKSPSQRWPSNTSSALAPYDAALLATIRELCAAEISFIPVHGIHAQVYKGEKAQHLVGAKEPAIPKCRAYQHERLPTEQEVQAWLNAGLFGGIGIYCGDVSGIICADIDVNGNLSVNDTFVVEFPDLLDTYTERTPTGGTHRFYRLPPGRNAPRTLAAKGYGELRGKGALVVVAPTRWGEQAWSLERGEWSVIPTLSDDRLERLMDFYRRQGEPIRVRPVAKPNPASAVASSLSALGARSSSGWA